MDGLSKPVGIAVDHARNGLCALALNSLLIDPIAASKADFQILVSVEETKDKDWHTGSSDCE